MESDRLWNQANQLQPGRPFCSCVAVTSPCLTSVPSFVKGAQTVPSFQGCGL